MTGPASALTLDTKTPRDQEIAAEFLASLIAAGLTFSGNLAGGVLSIDVWREDDRRPAPEEPR